MDSSYSGYWLIVSTVFTKQGLIIIFIIILKLMLCSVWVSTKIFPCIILPQETLTPHLIGGSLRMIQIRISDARSLGSWYIKWAHESFPRVVPLVSLLCYDLSYLGSLVFIWIIPMERTLRPSFNDTVNPLKGGGLNKDWRSYLI